MCNICANNEARNVYRILRETPTEALTAEDYIAEGDAYVANSQLEHAISSYLTALELDPTQHDLRCKVGMLYVDLQQIESAQSQFLIVISQDANNQCARSQLHNVSEWMYYRLPELNPPSSTTAQINDVDRLYDIALSMGVRSLLHEAQMRHENGDVWTASALLDRYIDENYATMCAGELRWLADEYAQQSYTVMADMMRLKAIGDSTC